MLAGLRRWLKTIAIVSPGRDREQQPDRVVAALGLQPGQRVADLGSGSGYFTFRLVAAPWRRAEWSTPWIPTRICFRPSRSAPVARAVGHAGAARTAKRSRCPEPVDLIFLSHSFHHLPGTGAYLGARARSACAGRTDRDRRRPAEGPFPSALRARHGPGRGSLADDRGRLPAGRRARLPAQRLSFQVFGT